MQDKLIIVTTACVSPTALIEPGAIILPDAVIYTGAQIGAHAFVNLRVKIDHDVSVGQFVHVAPMVALGGGARIEDHAYVAMGAVVTKEFPSGSTLVGIAAKPQISKA